MTPAQQLLDRLWERFEAQRRELFAMIGMTPEQHAAADKEFYIARVDALNDLEGSEFMDLLERTDKLADAITKLRGIIAMQAPEADDRVLQ